MPKIVIKEIPKATFASIGCKPATDIQPALGSTTYVCPPTKTDSFECAMAKRQYDHIAAELTFDVTRPYDPLNNVRTSINYELAENRMLKICGNQNKK